MESFQCSTRCGCSPNARQIREIAVWFNPTPAAIWDGPGGLLAAVEQAIQDLRPIGIYPLIQEAEQVAVGVRAVRAGGLAGGGTGALIGGAVGGGGGYAYKRLSHRNRYHNNYHKNYHK